MKILHQKKIHYNKVLFLTNPILKFLNSIIPDFGKDVHNQVFSTFLEGLCIVPCDLSIQFTQVFCVFFHIPQLKLDCTIFLVLAVTVGSLSLYSRHQKLSVSEVRTVYQQRSRHGHFMGADPDKRILKLPRRLKAVKTTVTVITNRLHCLP